MQKYFVIVLACWSNYPLTPTVAIWVQL